MAKIADDREFKRRLCEVVGLNPEVVRSIAIVAEADGLPVVRVKTVLTEEQLGQLAPLAKGVFWGVMPADSPYADDPVSLMVPKGKPASSTTGRVPASAVRQVPRDQCVGVVDGTPLPIPIDLARAILEARAAPADTPVTVGG